LPQNFIAHRRPLQRHRKEDKRQRQQLDRRKKMTDIPMTGKITASDEDQD
jgi:hypothetical protein